MGQSWTAVGVILGLAAVLVLLVLAREFLGAIRDAKRAARATGQGGET